MNTIETSKARSIARGFMAAFFALGFSAAQQASADLGEAATNPVSNLVQFRLQNQHSWENYNADSWSNAGLIQTVVPLPSVASKFDSLKGIVTALIDVITRDTDANVA